MELTKKLMCISMRNGIDKWIEEERVINLKAFLKNNGKGFVEIGNEMINTADVVGIFEAKTLEDLTRKKNGEWKCQHGAWHTRGQECECTPPQSNEYIEKIVAENKTRKAPTKSIREFIDPDILNKIGK